MFYNICAKGWRVSASVLHIVTVKMTTVIGFTSHLTKNNDDVTNSSSVNVTQRYDLST